MPHDRIKTPVPRLSHVCDYTVDLAPIIEMGEGRGGQRRIIPIVGGAVTGPRLTGKVMALGADWQTVLSGGMVEMDTRYAIETSDGAVIEVRNYGYRHGPADVLAAIARGEQVSPDAYYMRTQARLETGDSRYAWVNRTLFVGTGARLMNTVHIALYAID